MRSTSEDRRLGKHDELQLPTGMQLDVHCPREGSRVLYVRHDELRAAAAQALRAKDLRGSWDSLRCVRRRLRRATKLWAMHGMHPVNLCGHLRRSSEKLQRNVRSSEICARVRLPDGLQRYGDVLL